MSDNLPADIPRAPDGQVGDVSDALESEDIPRQDLPPESLQPETQGASPEIAELGEDGQGDLAPEDY